jgi:hypothetical protein
VTTHTIKLTEAEYRALERSAQSSGLSVRAYLRQLITRARSQEAEASGGAQSSRWARLSERVRRDPPLRGAGELVLESTRRLREDFALTRGGA